VGDQTERIETKEMKGSVKTECEESDNVSVTRFSYA
jgi:hypothetical protein